MPKFIQKKNYITLGFDFIEKYISEANPTYIIIYIYALRLAAENIETDYSYIAQKLNLIQSDVIKAFEYWKQAGVIRYDGENIIFGELNENTSEKDGKNVIYDKYNGEEEKNSKENRRENKKENRKEAGYIENKHYDNIELSNDIQINELLADMLEKAQEFLGKPLNTNEIHTLYSMYEQLALPPQVIVLLIEYCVSKNKTNMNYIEKIAVSWNEKGIDTIEKALDFLDAEKSRNELLGELKKIFCLYDRNFTEGEEEIILNWINSYNTDVELIKYAYEITVMNTNKFSVQYMDKIIERWHREGVYDISTARENNGRFRQNRQNQNNQNKYEVYRNDSYDYKDLENREWKK